MSNVKYLVVIVENEFSGNVGSIARLMGNFDFNRLILVNPLWKDETEGKWMAHTDLGKRIFENRVVYKDFDDFLFNEKPHIVVAFTRRSGKDREISSNHKEFFQNFYNSIMENKLNNQNFTVALIFGKESTGLEDSIIQKCEKLLYIPTNPESPSLNLAQAVCIILSEIYYIENIQYKNCLIKKDHEMKESKKIVSGLNFEVESIFKLATTKDKEKFFEEIIEASKRKKLFIRNDVEKFKRLFNRIFTSPYITKKDLNLLKKYLMRFIFAPLIDENKKI
ncbi:MAG: RNA methyltransferase [Spirochaetes bacterium]|nr:RNA methyltransferase [Spirochaetota bacterium]